MSKVLKLLNKNLIINLPLNQLILDGGNVVIPIIKDKSGVYVQHTKENEQRLNSHGQGFLSGVIELVDSKPIFHRNEPHSNIQIMLDLPKDLGISLPAIYGENGEVDVLSQLETICMLVDRKFSFTKAKLVSVPQFSLRNNFYTFELFQYRPGFVKGVHLVHNEMGIVRIALRHDYERKAHKLTLEQKFFMVDSREIDR